MNRIYLEAAEGKILKLQTEEAVVFGKKVQCTEEQASQWVEVPVEEYEEYQRQQDEINEEEQPYESI